MGPPQGRSSQISFNNAATDQIDGVTYRDVLSETMSVTANVPIGVIGEASATYDTQGAQKFKEHVTGAPAHLNVVPEH